jgi:hypothetical protein
MPVRTLLGVAVATAALGLSLVAPTGASAAPATGTVVRTATVLPTLKSGSTGSYVTRIQRILAIKQTGVYDKATVAAVKRLQTWKRISPINGVVSGTTWPALNDATLGAAYRDSKTKRATLPFLTWQASVHGHGISYRESKNSCTVLSASGSWRGKWQMSLSLWKANGGLVYAASPEKASCLAQDKVAYRVWIRSWWSPWGG